MHQRSVVVLALAIGAAHVPTSARAQSAIYHLHKEASVTTERLLLKTAAPDAAAVTLSSPDLKHQPASEYLVKAFDTQPGVPNAPGTIPAGSTVNVTVWMKKSANVAAMYPRVKVNLNSPAGPSLCVATGPTPLTIDIKPYMLRCTTSSQISTTNADRLYVWVGINVTTGAGNSGVKGQLQIEGVLNGAYDSWIDIPLPSRAPVITALAPTTGPVGTSVTISGTNLASSSGFGAVTFNGVAAAVTTGTTSTITTVVPVGATTGPVVVTVGGLVSNAAPFTVPAQGSLGGLVRRSSDGNPVPGATVDVLRNQVVVVSTTTNAAGEYLVSPLTADAYDVRASAADLASATHTGIVVPAGETTREDFALARAYGVVTYTYDDVDRLVGVVDQDGASAAYRYDAVGNIVSIARQGANVLTILGFSPTSGPVGTTVRISGGGFDPSPANNTVRFNGSTALVTFATTTQLVVSVPAAATSGTIGVDTPSRSAVSAAPFSVTSVTGAPTVTGFSPPIAAAGTSIVITGSNFDPVPANNIARLSLSLLTPSSIAADAITAPLGPSASSGHVSVRTPSGSAASTGILFVPPPTFDVGDVGIARVVAIGEQPSFVRQTGKIGLLAFDGAARQRIGVIATEEMPLTLFDPYGREMTSAWDFLGPVILPVDGTYTVLQDRCDQFFCPATFTTTVVEVPPDVVGTIRLDGTPVAVTLATPGQQAHLTFSAEAGQHIGIAMPSGTIECCSWISMVDPNGYAVVGDFDLFFNVGEFADLVLPESGTYTLDVVPNVGKTGSFTLALTSIVDLVGALNVDGPPLDIATSQPGQNATITFSGSAAAHVGIDLTNPTFESAMVSIENPDGTLLTNSFALIQNIESFKEATLPQTGIYRIVVDPQQRSTGAVTVAVTTIPPDATAMLTIGGPEVSITIPVRGQRAALALDATAGQRFAIHIITSTIDFFEIRVTAPGGTATSLGWGNRYETITEMFDVHQSGTYTIALAPVWGPGTTTTGTITLSAIPVAPDITGNLTVGGPPVSVTFTTIRQRAVFSFAGTAGQQITAWARNDSAQFLPLFITICDPHGTPIAGSSGGAQPGQSLGRPLVLTEAGTYSAWFELGSASSGTISVSVTTP